MTLSVDKDTKGLAWHVLIQIDGATSLYLSDHETATARANGWTRVWTAHPIKLGDIKEQLTDAYARNPRYGSVSIDITDDLDGALLAWLKDNKWAVGSLVTIWLLEDGATDAAMAWQGHVLEPNDIEFDEEKRVFKLDVTDRRLYEKDKFPPTEVDTSTSGFKYAAEDWNGEKVPVLYGDWSETAISGDPVVECVIKDTGVRDEKPGREPIVLQIADPNQYGLKFIDERVLCRFANPYDHDGRTDGWLATSNIDLDKGTCEVAASQYDKYADGDKFYVYCQGNKDASGSLIANPAAVWRDLLMEYANPKISADYIHNYDIAFAELENREARIRIAEEIDLMELVDELAFEYCMCWGVRPIDDSGAWRMKYWLAPFKPFMEAAYYPTSADYRIEHGHFHGEPALWKDPDEEYADRVVVKYRLNPRSEKWGASYTTRLGESQMHRAYGVDETVETRRIESKFIHRWYDAMILALHQLFLHGKRPQVYEASGHLWTMPLYLGQNITIRTESLADRYCKVVGLERDLGEGSAKLRLLDISDRFAYGRWTSDDEEPYTSQDDEGKEKWGFWTDDDGLCDPTDPTSLDSNWVL